MKIFRIKSSTNAEIFIKISGSFVYMPADMFPNSAWVRNLGHNM